MSMVTEMQAKSKWHKANRKITACPHCKNPIKVSAEGRAWLLLCFPWALLTILDIICPDSHTILLCSLPALLIALIGFGMAAWTAVLAKADGGSAYK